MTPTLDELLRGCESEALHLSGAIQPSGVLLRVDLASGRVTHASTNLPLFGGPPVEAVLGRTLDELGWLAPAARARLPQRLGKGALLPVGFDGVDAPLVAHVVRDEAALLVEIERGAPDPAALEAARREERALIGPPPRYEALAEHQARVVAAMRTITGFDRVMLYRFHEDWTGEVVAESLREGVGGYLGLRFPASDIPAIARDLYLATPCRAIPDALAAPVPVVGLAPAPPDLTRSGLRSVSPVHLEYLANMGVRASLSLRVRVGDRLWGLFACHHLAPRALAPELREAASRVADGFGAGLASSLASHRLQFVDGLDRRLAALFEASGLRADPLGAARAHGAALIDLVHADGLAMRVDDATVTVGDVPDAAALDVVDRWFCARGVEPVFATHHLVDAFPDERALLAAASGLLAVKWRRGRGAPSRCYWFRRQVVEEVTWAGEPSKAVVQGASGARLSPRRSFAAWVETKLGYARPFTNEDRMTAARFRNRMAGEPTP